MNINSNALGARNCAALPVGSSLVGRFAPRAGLVISRQTFVRRCHDGWGHCAAH
jgi:hypothetical protein